ncbi:TPA: hypothetical protein EYO63_15230 [Candidatus Poribacteria bacterium]|nr:hypothetical protein [Candidatus Poribacteria bacterium]
MEEIEDGQDNPDIPVDGDMANATGSRRKLNLDDLSIDQLVWHQQFGHGQIIAINESNQEIRIMVRFETAGYKALMAQCTRLYTSQDNGQLLDPVKTNSGATSLPVTLNDPLGIIESSLAQGLNFFKGLLN